MAGKSIVNKAFEWLLKPSQTPTDIGSQISGSRSEFLQSFGWNGANLVPFDGEKTPLELGRPTNWFLDYYSMRIRAWEAYLMSDVVQNAIEKYSMWVIGTGLKLQAEPIESIISGAPDMGDFIKVVEDKFRLFANSKNSVYSGMQSLHLQAIEAFKSALLAGDCLCILRYQDNKVTLELVDGIHVTSPIGNLFETNIVNGVQFNNKGEHEGYYILNADFTHTFVSAKNNMGQTVAWLMYGRRYKPNDVRGMSLLSAVLETVSKLDRYKDATLGAAEENSKIPYTIEHDQFSTGENPLINQMAQSLGKNQGTSPETQSKEQSDNIATKVARTTSKMAYNMPVGSKLKRHESDTDINFKDFFGVNIGIVYATIGIPPEVALDNFEGSYSSSRAALKSWEYNLLIKRTNLMKNQYYKPFYDFWLDIQVISGNIVANGYQTALKNNDFMTLEAFRNARFIGATVPHIDPLKEVIAERKKLGSAFDTIPLTSADQSCENLNTGDFQQILKKAINEKNNSSEFIVNTIAPVDSTTKVPGKSN